MINTYGAGKVPLVSQFPGMSHPKKGVAETKTLLLAAKGHWRGRWRWRGAGAELVVTTNALS